MIRAYKDTWQFYVRLMGFTTRRGDYVPYFINSTLQDFLNETSDPVLDMGCGENNLKLFYPNIHGVDRTLEADTYSFVGEQPFLDLPKYKYGVAVNSIHWGDIHSNIDLVLQKCKRVWISLNENHPIEDFKLIETWKQHGEVEYFWHGQKPETKELIREHLDNDHMYHYIAKRDGRTLDADVETVYNNTVINDPYFGVVRVIVNAT